MKRISIDEFGKFKMPSDISFSPDGRRACFVLTEADMKQNTYRSYLYELLDGGKVKQLTTGGKERSFIFIDNETLLYKADGNEVSSTYNTVSLKTGKISKAFTLPICAGAIAPLRKGRFAILARTYPGYEDMYKGDPSISKDYMKNRETSAEYEDFDEVSYYVNGRSFIRGVYNSLYLYDPGKKSLRRLTTEGFVVTSFQVAPEGGRIYFIGCDRAESRNNLLNASLWRIDASGRNFSLVRRTADDFGIKAFCLGPDFAVVLATDFAHGQSSDGDFYKLSYENDEFTPWTQWDRRISSSIDCDAKLLEGFQMQFDNDAFYFTSTVDEEHPLFKLENGEIIRVNKNEGEVVCFDVREGKILIAGLYDMRPLEIYDGYGKQLTDLNMRILKGKYLAKPERLDMISHGQEIRGFVYKPINFEKGKKYPAILYIHGGPKSVVGPVYFQHFQYWCSCGYIVLACNPCGSDGRGSVFADIRGMYGTDDYEDLMDFCDTAIEAYPEIDIKNLFATGMSYGGYMINWIIGHTNRFKACVSASPIPSWLTRFIADAGVNYYISVNDGSPWHGGFGNVWKASPLVFADQVKTPTLFLHSMNDYRSSMVESLQMYTAIKDLGVEARCYLVRSESPSLFEIGAPVSRVKMLQVVTDWFEKHRSRR